MSESFAIREGLEAPKSLQIEGMDDDLRRCIWNVLNKLLISPSLNQAYHRDLVAAIEGVWIFVLKRDADEVAEYFSDGGPEAVAKDLFKDVFFSVDWKKVYSIVEHLIGIKAPLFDRARGDIEAAINYHLEEEASAYRIIDHKVRRLTGREEVSEVSTALGLEGEFKAVSGHISASARYLDSRELDDWRNSIKEAVSAVEAMARLVTGDKNATLGQAVKVIEKKNGMHKALKESISSLYGYAGDADGIRHAMKGEPGVSHNEARLILVVCSALVNYLKPFVPSSS